MPPVSEFFGVRDVCLGGGGLWFGLCPGLRPAVLSDINQELIDTYIAVREMGPAVMAVLDIHYAALDKAAAANDYAAYQAYYYALRAQTPEQLPLAERAARMIALNKSCHSGVYRKSKGEGRFNTPCARPTPKRDGTWRARRLYDGDNLRRVAAATTGVLIEVRDIVAAIDAALPGELILCDPPYDPLKKGGFTNYDGAGFDDADQVRTAAALRRAAARGCFVAAMNHDTPLVRKLYKGFTFHNVYARRSSSPKSDGRILQPELLMVLDGRRSR